MEYEKKKALLDLIEECDDVDYLRQIAVTANAIADAIDSYKKALNIMKLYQWFWSSLFESSTINSALIIARQASKNDFRLFKS